MLMQEVDLVTGLVWGNRSSQKAPEIPTRNYHSKVEMNGILGELLANVGTK